MPGLIPVVKGNGYGFGRDTLMPIASELASHIAVGTVYEAADVPADRTPIVLTPHLGKLPSDLGRSAVLTVGHTAHVESLAAHGWTGNVTIKLQSSMRRYGVVPDALPALIKAVESAGLTTAGYSLHLPLHHAESDPTCAAGLAEIEQWLRVIDPDLALSVSHIDTDASSRLSDRFGDRQFHIRVGTALWHADKSHLQLTADVLDVHEVHSGDAVGYRGTVVRCDGYLVLVAAGSAHGIRALDDGRSPVHFERQRLQLLESPHMHTTLAFVPIGDSCPSIGDRVDIQRPLINTLIDELEWIS